MQMFTLEIDGVVEASVRRVPGAGYRWAAGGQTGSAPTRTAAVRQALEARAQAAQR